MKTKFVLSILVAFGWMGVAPVSQAELVYKFSGHITLIESDSAGLIAAAGLSVGSDIHYAFSVDFNRQAVITHYDGSIEELEDLPRPGEQGNIYADLFYANFLEGVFIKDPVASTMQWPNGASKNDGGIYSTNPLFSSGSFFHDGGYYTMSVFGENHPQFWKVGDQVNVFSGANVLDGRFSGFRGVVTLDQISQVPLPSLAWMFGAIVMVMFKRERYSFRIRAGV
ncbi:hypothetical protein PL263_08075 [Methylomonas sp. EFPC3]|uniref:hypothetical protein n=1 Tax=Methylomonas sp. EFPC3 TaxID=3021710 RepID=UPI00241670F8|nr:hypothetical protein [Methylomonas sp. EFPC3]WFP51979.1 hypothetical protein PL263_08075 [Methylomonas sp. EFPC3]